MHDVIDLILDNRLKIIQITFNFLNVTFVFHIFIYYIIFILYYIIV